MSSLRSEVWEETHLLPMRVKFQQEADGSIVMQLPGYQLSTVTVMGADKGEAIALMDERMYALMGKPSNAEIGRLDAAGGQSERMES